MIRLEIINDGTGAPTNVQGVGVGHYDVYLYLPGEPKIHANVVEYDRSLGWLVLARRAIQALADAQVRAS